MVDFAEATDPSGQIQLTYQYPSIARRKSRIDFIFVLDFCVANYRQTAHFTKISDHQVVSAFFISPQPKGLGVWRCVGDVLDACDLTICELINKAHSSSLSSMIWDSLKLQCKEEYSRAMSFRVKQHKKEIAALQTSLRHVNATIYQSGITNPLEKDRVTLQRRISNLEETIWEQNNVDH